jgi:hypothetical protein
MSRDSRRVTSTAAAGPVLLSPGDAQGRGINLRGHLRRPAIFLCLLMAIAFSHADSVRGDAPTSVSVGVERLSGQLAVLRLTATAGEKDAAFGFEYTLPTWPSSPRTWGSPIAIREMSINGPAVVRPARTPAVRPFGRGSLCRRGPASALTEYSEYYWVELPAGGSATIDLAAKPSFPSWPGTSYDVRFSVFYTDDVFAPRYPLPTVSVPHLALRGTRIDMKADKAGRVGGDAGLGPEIVGSTRPPLRHGRISLRAVRLYRPGSLGLREWSGPAAVRLEAVQTDGNGRFRIAPQHLAGPGRYSYLARTEARGARAADWNCGPFFTVGS